MSDIRRVPHAAHWGSFTAIVRDGRLVEAIPREGDPYPSPMVATTPDAVNHRIRVARPAVRRGWLEGGTDRGRDRRGADDFVAVPWDEALDMVAGEVARVRRDHGGEAIFGGSYGWSSAGRFHHAKSQLHRFLNAGGGFTDQVQNYSYAAAITILPHILGTIEAVQGPVSSLDGLAAHCRLMVCFGGLPRINLQIEAGGNGVHTGALWLERMREAGIRIVCITPSKADVPPGAEWQTIRPNTDTAVMLAMAGVLLDQGLADQDFLNRCTVGAERVFAYLRGDEDGTPKTPEWAEAISGVPAATIRALALALKAERSFVNVSWSLQRADRGEQALWAAIALACMAGHVGLPGGGFALGLASLGNMGAPRQPMASPRIGLGRNQTGRYIPVARISDMMLNPGGAYRYNGQDMTYPDIRMVYWCGGNPFHHHQDLNRLVTAFRRPETVVVHEQFWTATARHADIVLPATTTLERNDIGASGRDRFILAMHKAIEPLGEARNDYDIFSGLARRLGIEDAFTEGRDEMTWLRALYAEAATANAARGIDFPDFDSFWQSGMVEVPEPETPYTMFADLRADPAAHPLHTPSGLIELHSERVASFGDAHCPGHPVWIAPDEWLGADLAGRYPLHLISHQPATRLHGQLDPAGLSTGAKIQGREPVVIHPDDAARRGIGDGMIVRVFNDRGATLAGAVVSADVMPGVVRLATGAWYDPVDPSTPGSLDKHGNPNVLTADRPTSAVSQAPSAHSTLVEIEVFDGTPPAVTAFEPPVMTPRRQEAAS
ncbi:molybdopterin-dependent oxidoreductase [Tistrella bauzanensis]|uniref:Molybdopterin-dependent oxidoreductase n=1 Tax=Tistrella arctica TaxID=3133430 RepID=A0ABU9YE01_9PROT